MRQVPPYRIEKSAGVSGEEKFARKMPTKKKKRSGNRTKKDSVNLSRRKENDSDQVRNNGNNEKDSMYNEVLQALKRLRKNKKSTGTAAKYLNNGMNETNVELASSHSSRGAETLRKNAKCRRNFKSLVRGTAPKTRRLEPPAWTTYITEF